MVTKQSKNIEPSQKRDFRYILIRNVFKSEDSAFFEHDEGDELKKGPMIVQKPSKITISTKMNRERLK